MNAYGITGLLIVLVTFFGSVRGFRSPAFFGRFSLTPPGVLGRGQYYRLLTAGFLHTGWPHLLVNLLALLTFVSALALGRVPEAQWLGPSHLLLLYGIGLVGGNALTLWLHRRDPAYEAVGASGAISAVVLATVALAPWLPLYVPFTLAWVPAWLWGGLYLVVSAYGLTTQRDNVGHEAHLGGGLAGLLTLLVAYPALLRDNAPSLLLVTGLTLGFFWLLWRQPEALRVSTLFRGPGYQTLDDQYNTRQKERQHELDHLLDKIGRHGYDSLSTREKKQLEELSK